VKITAILEVYCLATAVAVSAKNSMTSFLHAAALVDEFARYLIHAFVHPINLFLKHVNIISTYFAVSL